MDPLRHAYYEVFLTLHRLGVAIAITGLYFHLAKHALPQLPWMYIIATLLALEYMIRAGRILYYNVSWKQCVWTQITIEALPGEATRVTFSLSRSWNANPGSHVQIYLPRIALWSSHPFSIAWLQSCGYAKLDPEKLPSTIEDLRIEEGPSTVSCVIRARKGMTRKLFSLASKTHGDTVTLWGAVEGPYGGFHTLDWYGAVVLFAGGVGITQQLPFVQHLLLGHARNTASTRQILLVWCIPSIEVTDWIEPWLEEISAMENFPAVVRVRVYVSKENPTDMAAQQLPDYIDVRRHRCDPQDVLDEEILAQADALAVSVCGPSGLNNSVREAVRRRLSLRDIDFFEESFSF